MTDVFFIRRALRDSLRRTLRRFATEAEEEAGPVALAAAGSRRSRIPDFGGQMFVFKAAVVGAGTMGGEIAQVDRLRRHPGRPQGRRAGVRRPGPREGPRRSPRASSAAWSRRRRSPRSRPTASSRRSSGRITGTHRLRGLRRRRLRDRGRARADGDQAGGVRRARRRHARPRDPRVQHLVAVDHRDGRGHAAGPTRSCGFHFFYPASMMRLIEVIEGDETSEETLQTAANFAQADPQDGRSAAARCPASWSTASSTRRSPRSGA